MKHILVATDGSDHAKRAVDMSADLAQAFGAKVTVIHAVHDVSMSMPPELEAWARIEHVELREGEILAEVGQRIASEAEKRLHSLGVQNVDTVVRAGDPAAIIVGAARDQEADLIVMGRRGLSKLAELFQGSVSQKVSHLAHVSVLTVQ